ncbi:MAG: TfoX/Sxy family protein [Candidatus Krumholzibacteria bacterium]|nr:TfoX/Sxy family protein [Candidatus Krumholzibacteria bacterium]MDH4337579.1 TfoX/Sxy family protein [Candidatus Krumholzibacteria bacterium]MDH5270381.1 TfoX/Sxy family protein [Candidatus Krumholzibacteria bacterium]
MAAKDNDFLEFVTDQLSGLRGLTSRRMFGAIGLYHGENFFAIIDDGILYFITDEQTRPRYEALGMKPFEYAPGKFLRTYYPVPVDVLEDDIALQKWAEEAVAVQKRKGTKKPGKPRNKTTKPKRKT